MSLIASLFTLGAWSAWGYIVLFVDPEAPMALVAFYGALFVALTGSLSRLLAGSHPAGEEPSAGRLLPSIGHGASVSTLILFALWLQSLDMLTPLNGTLLGATLALIEVGFLVTGGRRRAKTRRRPRRPAPHEVG